MNEQNKNRSGGWKQSSLEPSEPLKWQGSLAEEEEEKEERKSGKGFPFLLIAAAAAVLLAASGISGLMRDHPEPVREETEESPEPAQVTGEESVQESPAEEEPEPPAEIISPENFGDQICYFESDRYITNISHYADGRLIGNRQEAVVAQSAFFYSFDQSPVFINHMSDYLSFSYEGDGSFPFTDFTFSYKWDSAEEIYRMDLEYFTEYPDSYLEIQLSDLLPYTASNGEEYMVYQTYIRRDSGPSLESHAIREMEGGAALVISFDQFYTSSSQAEFDFAFSGKVEDYPEIFMELLDSISFYYGEDLYEITAASPAARQAYYSYYTGLTVITHVSPEEVSMPFYGFDNYKMTDNSQSLYLSGNKIYSSKSYDFMYFAPHDDIEVDQTPSYFVKELISYEFFDMTEDNYMTLTVMDGSGQPTGQNAGPIRSYQFGPYSVNARYLEQKAPGSSYPYGNAEVVVWFPLKGNTGLAIRDHFYNFGEGPSQDVGAIAERLMNTIEIQQ